MEDNTTEQTGKEMKTAKQIFLKHSISIDFENRSADILIEPNALSAMEEYADQFRKPTPPLPEGKDKYEEEIEKQLLDRFGFVKDGDEEGVDCEGQLKIFSFMDWFKKNHHPAMKEKDEEIEKQYKRAEEWWQHCLMCEDREKSIKEENAKQSEEIEKLRGLVKECVDRIQAIHDDQGGGPILKTFIAKITEALKQKE